jgi:hypothetical protein
MPVYIKLPGIRGIDSYTSAKNNFYMPDRLKIYHSESLDSRIKRTNHPDAMAVSNDRKTTFGMVDYFFMNICELLRTFKSDEQATEASEETIVDAPIIHI